MTVTPAPPAQKQITVLCVICLDHVLLHQVTAGTLYTDGQQAFACSSHLFDRRSWISSWALLDIVEPTADPSVREMRFAV